MIKIIKLSLFLCLWIVYAGGIPTRFTDSDSSSDEGEGKKPVCVLKSTLNDMIKPASSLRDRRYVLTTTRAWPNREIPFLFSPDYDQEQQKIVKQVLAELQAQVNEGFPNCINIREFNWRTDNHAVKIINGVKPNGRSRCESDVGYLREPNEMRRMTEQELSLGYDHPNEHGDLTTCISKRTIMHEFMHSLGFLHEHQRPDRDTFVEVWPDEDWTEDYYQNAFAIIQGGKTFGIPYNPLSIMHYSTVSEPTYNYEAGAWECSVGVALIPEKDWDEDFKNLFYHGKPEDRAKIFENNGLADTDKKNVRCFYNCIPSDECKEP